MYNIENLEYDNSFTPKAVLRSEYGMSFEHQDFLCKDFTGCILLVLDVQNKLIYYWFHHPHQILTTGEEVNLIIM